VPRKADWIFGWTAQRATGPGLMAGLVAFFLWPIFASFPDLAFYPFVMALFLASFCGISILALTIVDLRNNRRGRKIRPIRTFDMVLGLALFVPPVLELTTLLG